MSEETETPAVELIKLFREEPQFEGGPTEADVHPDELSNYLAAGWETETGEVPAGIDLKPVSIDGMDIDQLREAATNEGVDFGPRTTYEELVAMVKANREAPAAAPVVEADEDEEVIDVDLDEMTIAELRAFAAEHNIAVSNNPNTKIETLRKTIREAFDEVEATLKKDADGKI